MIVHYATPPKLIGKHTWRMVVKDSERHGRVTDYEFLDSAGDWTPQNRWPTYDSNDGCYAGCPKGLVKVFQAHRLEIEAALEQREVVREPTLLDRLSA